MYTHLPTHSLHLIRQGAGINDLIPQGFTQCHQFCDGRWAVIIYRLPPLPPTPSPLFGEPFVAVQPVLFGWTVANIYGPFPSIVSPGLCSQEEVGKFSF